MDDILSHAGTGMYIFAPEAAWMSSRQCIYMYVRIKYSSGPMIFIEICGHFLVGFIEPQIFFLTEDFFYQRSFRLNILTTKIFWPKIFRPNIFLANDFFG